MNINNFNKLETAIEDLLRLEYILSGLDYVGNKKITLTKNELVQSLRRIQGNLQKIWEQENRNWSNK